MTTNDPRETKASLSRRHALSTIGLGAAALTSVASGPSPALAAPQPVRTRPSEPARRRGPDTDLKPSEVGWNEQTGRYVLPPLPYDADALEPYLDEETMRLHHDTHHAGYVRGLNASLDALDEIRRNRRDAGEVKRWSRQLAFNASGHFLHVTFWNSMSPEESGSSERIAEQLDRDFGSYDQFARHFKAAAGSVEGSGWGVLAWEPMAGRLVVMQAEKHQNLGAWGVVPLLVVDVWEHAYYLKYRNRRADYIDAFMNVVNWDYAERRLGELMA